MKSLRKTVLLACVTFTGVGLWGCDKTDCEATERKPDCICTEEYAPVCGCDGKTYGNACEAKCHGITEYTEGECDN